MLLKTPDIDLDIRIDYQKRKKMRIEIDTAGRVKVLAPKGMEESLILKAVEARADWILKRLMQLETMLKMPEIKVRNPEICIYLGKEVQVDQLFSCEGLSETEIRTALEIFYMKSCRRLIQERLTLYEKKLRLKSKGFEIEDSKQRWGSCRTDGHLTFNYRLIMAPIEVIDYVVVHEICHLKHMNHDRSFWRLLGSIIKDYKLQIEYLQRNGHEMVL